VWDNKHDNLVYAQVSELNGNYLGTDEIGGDKVYCYDYDDFDRYRRLQTTSTSTDAY
jgi:hypothetical protein